MGAGLGGGCPTSDAAAVVAKPAHSPDTTIYAPEATSNTEATYLFEVKLTDVETALFVSIQLDAGKLEERNDCLQNGELVLKLVLSLVGRDAIPEHRWRWLNDPEYNIGGLGSSRKDVFERNGTAGDNIPRHAHFLPCLRYFILGPDLPVRVIAAFDERVRICGKVTSSDVIPLGRFARHHARAAGLERRSAGDEFFKLALEYDLGIGCALAIRKQVLRVS